jgi:hypothetical protein
MVVEESIMSTRREEEAKNRVVEVTFETLCEERLRPLLCAKRKCEKVGRATGVSQFSTNKLVELWITARKSHAHL